VIVGSNVSEEAQVFTDQAAHRTLVQDGKIEDVLKELAGRGIMHVLCEGGGELAGSLIRAGLVDEFIIFMAPFLLEGSGVPMAGKQGWALSEMPRLIFQSEEKYGDDICIRAVPCKEES